ncbi:MAG TPA: type II toxin-antitoxin system VapC family toxin [Geminicoccaceae bacterium]|nr:type II toxin-antitoxin system VapC family toxin [Geminicoccaceae bacterium]
MTAFVLDASIALAWCFADEATPATDALLDRLADEEAAAPALWRLEVANALSMAESRGRLSVAGLTRSVSLLQRLAVAIDPEGSDRALRELLDLARSERLTVYDAAYLELALRLGLPLASKDASLRTAAAGLGLALLGA